MKIVQDGARVVLADVTHGRGATSMAVWAVIGIVGALPAADKVVPMGRVIDGQASAILV